MAPPKFSNMGKPKFAYLRLREHPYGREMLGQILSEGFVPDVIIEEDSGVADEERDKFLKRVEGNPIARTIEEQAVEHGRDVVSVPVHKSPEDMPHLKGRVLDTTVSGGTRNNTGAKLDHTSDGATTSHPGLRPDRQRAPSPAS